MWRAEVKDDPEKENFRSIQYHVLSVHENILGHGGKQEPNTPSLCQEIDQTFKAGGSMLIVYRERPFNSSNYQMMSESYSGKVFRIKQVGKYFVRSVA